MKKKKTKVIKKKTGKGIIINQKNIRECLKKLRDIKIGYQVPVTPEEYRKLIKESKKVRFVGYLYGARVILNKIARKKIYKGRLVDMSDLEEAKEDKLLSKSRKNKK